MSQTSNLENLEIIHRSFFNNMMNKIISSRCTVITTHQNADVDALASAIGLFDLCKQYINQDKKKRKSEKILKNIHVIIPEMNKIANHIKKTELKNDFTIEKEWPERKIDLLIVVDTNNIAIANLPSEVNLKEKKCEIKEIFLIDHHIKRNRDIESDIDEIEDFDEYVAHPALKIEEFLTPKITLTHILPDFSSATEIIIELFRINDITPPPHIAMVLLMGILTDTGNFRYANARTMDNGKYLLETGVYLQDAIHALQTPVSRAQKIAQLRAAMRINHLRYFDKWLVAVSHVSSYEASACKSLIKLGCSLGFIVAFEKKSDKFRISSRAEQQILKDTSLNLSIVMDKVGKKFGGNGGGHPGAAGCFGKIPSKNGKNTNLKKIENALIQVLEEELGIKMTVPT